MLPLMKIRIAISKSHWLSYLGAIQSIYFFLARVELRKAKNNLRKIFEYLFHIKREKS